MGHREDFAFTVSEMEPQEGSEQGETGPYAGIFTPDLAAGEEQIFEERRREGDDLGERW